MFSNDPATNSQLLALLGVVAAFMHAILAFVVADDGDEEESNENALVDAIAAFRRVRKRKRKDEEEEENPSPKHRRKFDYKGAYNCIQRDWLGPFPLYERDFEGTFRVTRSIVERILQISGKEDAFLTHRKLLNGEPGIYPECKVLMALKLLAYGVSPTAFMDYFQMHKKTGRDCLKNLCKVIAKSELRKEYLRPFTKADALKLSRLHEAEFGVAGCLGMLDCMHFYWRLCPKGWHGQYEGKEGCVSIVLEAVSDYYCWIWHSKFGFPGTLNDINIWDRSSLLRRFLDGTMRQIDFEFIINGKTFNTLWFLVDGIYPELSRFVKTLSEPISQLQKRYSTWQEKSRKSVERAFGIMQRKFQVLARPLEHWFEDDIANIVVTCLILHNMMVEVRVEREELESADFYKMAPPPSNNNNNNQPTSGFL